MLPDRSYAVLVHNKRRFIVMYYRPHSPNCSCSTVAARASPSALVDNDGYFNTPRHCGNKHYHHDAAGNITVPSSSSGPQMIVDRDIGGNTSASSSIACGQSSTNTELQSSSSFLWHFLWWRCNWGQLVMRHLTLSGGHLPHMYHILWLGFWVHLRAIIQGKCVFSLQLTMATFRKDKQISQTHSFLDAFPNLAWSSAMMVWFFYIMLLQKIFWIFLYISYVPCGWQGRPHLLATV